MVRWIIVASSIVLFTGVLSLGCREEMVGAPCVAETDNGNFNVNATGKNYSIETRSTGCETRICLTKTQKENNSDECSQKQSVENCWENNGGGEEKYPVQVKFSFCSCRCRDNDGNSYQTNPDKYDYLCECPPNTNCEEVLTDIAKAPEKLMGSYCVPKCIAVPCSDPGEICTPSKDSEKPWDWYCSTI